MILINRQINILNISKQISRVILYNFYRECFNNQFLLILELPYKINQMSEADILGDVPRKITSNFKSTSYIETNTRPTKLKVRRDMSTVSNYILNSQRKTPELPISRMDNRTLIQSYLPDINSKHRAQKRSSFLQMWLDEALDPQDTAPKEETNTIEVQKTGPLRTIQKFQIDKKYLKSQNMSGDLIDKLYNSLYVYTYGINNTFNEIVSLTKVNEHAQKKIVNNFWKAFIKLLQGCTSFRTTFQVIQESYKKQMIQIRQIFSLKELDFVQQQKTLQQQIAKLNKKISEQSYTISKLTNDYKISQSTLHLTDQAFNDEVNLRLRFEEKVNAIFTSYEEIRMKYTKLLQDLDIKGDEEVNARQLHINLKAQLEQSQIRNAELVSQISRLKQQLSQRQSQISLKFQEIYELSGRVSEFEMKRDQNEEQVRKIIAKLDIYRQERDIHMNEISIKTEQLKQYAKRITDQQQVIQRTRSANQSVYERYENAGKVIGDFNAERLVLQSKAKNAEAEAAHQRQQRLVIEAEKSSLEGQLSAREQEIKELKQEIENKTSFIEHNGELVRSLQAVKDKFERLYLLTSSQKKKMEEIMNEAVRMKEKFEEEMLGMKMLLENRNTQLSEANNKLQNEREVFRSKIASLKDQISAKDTQILDYHNKQLQDQSISSENAKKLILLKTDNAKLREEVLKIQAELIQKDIILKDGNSERDKNRAILKELNSKLEEISKEQKSNQFNLNNKTSLLQQLRGRADKQKQMLRVLLHSYRQDRQKKVSFIHPMLYEDCRAQIDRSTLKIEELNAKIQISELSIQESNRIVQQHLETINILKNALLKSQSENEIKKETIKILENNKKEIQETLTEKEKGTIEAETKNKQKTKEYEKTIESQQSLIAALKQEIQAKQLEVLNQKSDVQKLQDQRKIQKIHYLAQEDEISNLKGEIARLKEELGQFKRGDSRGSARAPALKRKTTSRQSNSRNQQRESISTSKLSNAQDLSRVQQKSLRPIEEESPQGKKVEIKQIQVEVRPSTVQRQAQTEKEKPKFTHSFRFEQVRPAFESYGCQVQIAQQLPQQNGLQVGPGYKLGRIEGEQFKRALKITYMRR